MSRWDRCQRGVSWADATEFIISTPENYLALPMIWRASRDGLSEPGAPCNRDHRMRLDATAVPMACTSAWASASSASVRWGPSIVFLDRGVQFGQGRFPQQFRRFGEFAPSAEESIPLSNPRAGADSVAAMVARPSLVREKRLPSVATRSAKISRFSPATISSGEGISWFIMSAASITSGSVAVPSADAAATARNIHASARRPRGILLMP